ncbi:fibronectin type III domain-containing protein [Chloroflexota bacterium]
MKLLAILLLTSLLTTACVGAPSSDTTSPTITEVAVSEITETSVVVTWTTNEPCDSQVECGLTTAYGIALDLETTLSAIHLVGITGLDADTTYHYRVKSSDAAGNQAVSSDYTFATDITAPTISEVTVTDISGTSAVVTWTTDEPSNSIVECGTTSSYNWSAHDVVLVTNHSVTLTGLTTDTTYHYSVYSEDAFDNSSVTADAMFTTLTVQPRDVATVAAEDDIFTLVNAERTESGLAALARSDALDTIAREYASSQFSEGIASSNGIIYLVYNAWHLDFTIGSPRFDEDTATEQVDFCVGEPDMLDALQREEATETGIGIATVGNTIYFTQVFDVIRTSGGDGAPIILTENPDATDPTWAELKAFLEADTTDEIPYVLGSFICGDYAEALHNNAEAVGIRTAYVSVRLTEEPGHALNAFNVGDTIVFIDVGSADKVAYLEVGKDYGAIVLDAAQEFTYTYFETYLADFEAYQEGLAEYNTQVEAYNDLEAPPAPHATRSEWYEELIEWLAALNAEKTALGIGETYFHPTEALAVDDPTVVDYYVHW